MILNSSSLRSIAGSTAIDVYVNKPCDILNDLLNYSPLWVRFSFLPGKEWTNPLGLCLAISFFLALAVLPPPRSAMELLPRLIATLSPVTTFAVERGNMDLLLFVMATAAGVLLLGPLPRRVAAYSLMVIAGTPENLSACSHGADVARAATGVLVGKCRGGHRGVGDKHLFSRGAREDGAEYIPTFGEISARTSFRTSSCGRRASATHPRLAGLVKLSTFAALFLAMVGWFSHMVRWRDFRIALVRLSDPEKIFLLIGAALIGGCFFAGSGLEYRGIHLLFTLPGLLAIARMEGDMSVRRLAVLECVLVVALTWALFFHLGMESFEQILAFGNVPGGRLVQFLWLLSQIAWWQVATLFIAILIGCCFDWFTATPEWRRLVRRAEVA